ncbi:uncharacterized protein isoform X2 [Choristoneura fumiferana]
MKNRWKNLKDTYRKCKNARLGKGNRKAKLAHWIWAEDMSFLDTGKDTPQSPNGDLTSSIATPASPIEATTSPIETPTSPIETPNSPIETPAFPIETPTFSIESPTSLSIKQEIISDNDESDNDLQSPDTENGLSEEVLKNFEVTVFENSNDKFLSLKRKKSGPCDKTNNDNDNYTKHTRNNVESGIVQVNCDRVDLFFLGLAHSFKGLSHRTQINTKFELAKVIRDAELSDLQDNE